MGALPWATGHHWDTVLIRCRLPLRSSALELIKDDRPWKQYLLVLEMWGPCEASSLWWIMLLGNCVCQQQKDLKQAQDACGRSFIWVVDLSLIMGVKRLCREHYWSKQVVRTGLDFWLVDAGTLQWPAWSDPDGSSGSCDSAQSWSQPGELPLAVGCCSAVAIECL